ncbi:MAG: alpha/beta fold hydrolase, partial [Pseudomonadota bacterium]
PAETTPAPPAPALRRPAGRRVVASPLARRVAKDLGVSLDGLTGTGPGGRIKRRDVVAAAPRHKAAQPAGAEPVLLLHGFGADTLVWPPLLLHLDGVSPVALALPGHGESAQPVTTPSLESLAEAVAQSVEREGAAAGHVVAQSLGGAVALELAAIGALTMRSLTLIAPAGLGPHINGPFLDGLTQAETVEGLAPWLALLFGADGSVPEGFARALHRRRPGPVRAAQRRLAQTLFPHGTQVFDRRPVLADLAIPVRVIWGLEDQIIPQSHADGLPGHVAVHRLKGVGHLPHVEAPGTVARIVKETIRSAS